jgi:hypothetical protein
MLIELLLSCAALANAADADGEPPPKPPDVAVTTPDASGVEWSALTSGSLRFLGVMHAFRLASEPGTRAGGFGVGSGYFNSAGNLHGWADGDPFYVNYAGHPMQAGSVASRFAHGNQELCGGFGGQSPLGPGRSVRGSAGARHRAPSNSRPPRACGRSMVRRRWWRRRFPGGAGMATGRNGEWMQDARAEGERQR